MNVILSSNPTNLKTALNECDKFATVEAEYGDIVIEGTYPEWTLAHHGNRSNNPCPCLKENSIGEMPYIIGLSHIDLDSLGGVLAIYGRKPINDEFWKLAAFVDINGVHRIQTFGASKNDIRRLNAWYAWSEKNKIFAPRDGSIIEVTEWIMKAEKIIYTLCTTEEGPLFDEGDAFEKRETELNNNSFRDIIGTVIIRKSEQFVNHLYTAPNGNVYDGVVTYNPKTNCVTISLEHSIEGVSCKDIAQKLWGEKAGGHVGIAGSPREGGLNLEEAYKAAILLNNTIQNLSK